MDEYQPEIEGNGNQSEEMEEPHYFNDDSSHRQGKNIHSLYHYLGAGGVEREPMLYVDVNLGSSGSQRIVVYEGDQAEILAAEFAAKFNLDNMMKEKLTIMLH